uniref:Protein-S-isoprenylcysteine O-methyltransferase n=1 Tax=Ganoderma boninense TaxID=34458 RepID=A0A5K1JVV6_9APHY|nr:NADPH oxidase 1 [Ganoderma boninense]
MAFLAPALSTPLLKVPLLLGHAAWTYHGMTPPKPPAHAAELKRIGSTPDFLSKSRFPSALRACSATAKLILCSVALTEAAVILAHHYPSPLSARLLRDVAHVLPSDPALSLAMTPLSALACALGIAGGAIRVWCHQTLGRFFTWEVAVRDGHELVTCGPYALVRHPSYTGWVLLIAGNFLLLASPHSLFAEAGLWRSAGGRAVAGTVMAYLGWVTMHLVRRTASEDEILRNEFGGRWDEWAARTPYRLIPFVY